VEAAGVEPAAFLFLLIKTGYCKTPHHFCTTVILSQGQMNLKQFKNRGDMPILLLQEE